MREIEIYQEHNNAALGQACSSNSGFHMKLTDGISRNGAYTEFSDNREFIIDLGESVGLKGVRVSQKYKFENKFEVYTSINGDEYTQEIIEGMSRGWSLFSPKRARFVKFKFLEMKPIFLNELRVLKDEADLSNIPVKP